MDTLFLILSDSMIYIYIKIKVILLFKRIPDKKILSIVVSHYGI